MKLPVSLFPLMAGILISGCAFHKQKNSTSVPKGSTLIVTPDASLAAKVVIYNDTGRFVVLSFPIGQMPKADQLFFLYRGGLKVGEIKIGARRQDNLVVADLTDGDAQVGDEVRDR